MAIVWLVVGVVLLFLELRHLAFYLLFVGLGCLAAAAVAAAAPSAIGVQAAVAVAVAVAGVTAVRPVMSRAFHHHAGGQVARGVHGGLVGQEALTLDVVGGVHERGHVRLGGERWLAVSGAGEPIAAGTPVVVTAVDGTTLTVWPTGSALPGKGPAAGELPHRPDEGPGSGAEGSHT
ncbi:MAG TPA: NfeD family protein [Acidimicrobiales bacterium]|nr:NfeD family protein [Acidimicrobiales bacterium]